MRLLASVLIIAPLLSAQTVIVPVTGAPYCADAVQEQKLTLTDGTHILRTTFFSHVCRDSAGRVWSEEFSSGGQGASQAIRLLDPVTGFAYRLDAHKQIARRGKLTILTPREPQLARNTKADSAVAEVEPESTVEPLGDKTMEGVRVTGTLKKTVYPTGTEGSDRPFTITDEIWLSPDLQVRIREIRSYPQSGDQINHLDRLTRSEPDPKLFQVPAGYQIVDEASQ